MMPKEIYFFDSYAIIEILKGSENYKKYTNTLILTTKLNLFEVYYVLLRDVGEIEANQFLDKYREYTITFEEDTITNSAKLKLQYKKRKISMTDCIGYTLAKKWGVKFLTGDKEFEHLDNVEFVK